MEDRSYHQVSFCIKSWIVSDILNETQRNKLTNLLELLNEANTKQIYDQSSSIYKDAVRLNDINNCLYWILFWNKYGPIFGGISLLSFVINKTKPSNFMNIVSVTSFSALMISFIGTFIRISE